MGGPPQELADLAQRLRALREEHWPDVDLTQAQLGRALGGSRPLSVPAISSWESPTSPRVPPAARLASYATFFATRRSLDGKEPRLLDESELTDDERATRDELVKELLTLRAAALADTRPTQLSAVPPVMDPLPRSGTWRFADGRPITIVCSELPKNMRLGMEYADQSSPDYVQAYAYAELDALLELHGHIRAMNPNSEVYYRTQSELTVDDYSTHLVLLGGVDWNQVTREVLTRITLPVRQVSAEDRAHDAYFEVREDGGQRKEYRPVIDETKAGPVVREDVAHFYRGPNPFNVKRTVTVCNAMFGRGTLGAVRALTDARFRDRNEEYITSRFKDRRRFSILVRVPLLKGMTLTPDWTLPEMRLHEWPKAARQPSQSGRDALLHDGQ